MCRRKSHLYSWFGSSLSIEIDVQWFICLDISLEVKTGTWIESIVPVIQEVLVPPLICIKSLWMSDCGMLLRDTEHCYTLTKKMLNQSGESLLTGLHRKVLVEWPRKAKHVLVELTIKTFLTTQNVFQVMHSNLVIHQLELTLQVNKWTTCASITWFSLVYSQGKRKKALLASLFLYVSTFFCHSVIECNAGRTWWRILSLSGHFRFLTFTDLYE